MNPFSPPQIRSAVNLRQFSSFFGVGVIAALVHYVLLVSLVERYRMQAVRATPVGYVAGGLVSYLLNRRHTYASDRPHREAGWRFAVVAVVGFGLTWVCMTLFVRIMGIPYIPAQVLTTGLGLVWSYLMHKFWTFREKPALIP